MITNPFPVNQFHRTSPPSVFGSLAFVVLQNPGSDILSNTGVKGVVGTADEIDGPSGAMFHLETSLDKIRFTTYGYKYRQNDR